MREGEATDHAQRLRAEHEHADHTLDIGSLADSVAGLVTEAGDWEEQDWEGAAALAGDESFGAEDNELEGELDYDAVEWADGPSEAEWEAAIEAAVDGGSETQLPNEEQQEHEEQLQQQEEKLQEGREEVADALSGDEAGN